MLGLGFWHSVDLQNSLCVEEKMMLRMRGLWHVKKAIKKV